MIEIENKKIDINQCSINELINIMNERVSKLEVRDTSAYTVRNYMEEEIGKIFSGNTKAHSKYTDSRSITITHPGVFFELNFNLSTKSTGEIQKITKLKSSYIKKADKVKFSDFHFRFNMPCYNYDQKTRKGSIDSKWTMSGDNIFLKAKDLDMDMKISDMNSSEFLLSVMEKNSDKTLKENILSNAFQPWIKTMFFNTEKIDSELGPYAKKFGTDKSDSNWPWHVALRVYEENNPEIVKQTIDWILKDSFEKDKL